MVWPSQGDGCNVYCYFNEMTIMKINPRAPSHPLFPLGWCTDYGNPERAFFQKFETFGLGQTNWAEILGGILAISSQTIGTILALWVTCSWESVAGSFSYKKHWFLGLKHTTPKYSQNKILAVKSLEKSLRTFVFGVLRYSLLGLNQ